MIRLNTDVLVIGSGGAGLRAALAVREKVPELEVMIVTKGNFIKDGVTGLSCSDRMAFHATLDSTEPLGKEAWKYHAQDIFEIGGLVSDQNLAEILAKNSKEAFGYLDELGVPFVKERGKVTQFVTDGSEYARACYTGPYTANHIAEFLGEKVVELKVLLFEKIMIYEVMLNEEGQIKGVWGVKIPTGELVFIEAPSIVLAAGGGGQVFVSNVYPDELTGDGYVMAVKCGAKLVNMEFIQIGLCSVKTKLACSGSFMRALPRIINDAGEDVLKKYGNKEVASELLKTLFSKGASWPASYEEASKIIDIVIAKENYLGKSVYLDYSQNPDYFDRGTLPQEIANWYMIEKKIDILKDKYFHSPLARLEAINKEAIKWLKERGIDLKKGENVEIAPSSQHFQGGVKINEKASTSVPGLFACGEVAGGQHGANRPGGSALLDTQVFGKIAGEEAALYVKNKNKESKITKGEIETIVKYFNFTFNKQKNYLREEINTIISESGGLLRTSNTLKEGLNRLNNIKEEDIVKNSVNIVDALECLNSWYLGKILLTAMYTRNESRGSHFMFNDLKTLIPVERDDGNWAYKYLTINLKESKVEIKKEQVKFGSEYAKSQSIFF